MKLLLALLIAVPVFGQDAVPQAKPAEQAKSSEQANESGQSAPAASEPAAAASAEKWLTGEIDMGYRYVPNVGGNPLQYRSVVNLGEGPKLFGLNFSIVEPNHKYFDRIDAWSSSWGGDPYNTAHLQAVKHGIYDLRADYRNIAYFNAIPSFGNPFAPGGFNQQSYDIRRRNSSVDLLLLPGRHIMPYFGYSRNSSDGTGITTFVQDSTNMYPVGSMLRDGTNNYRGGVHVEYNRFHVTLEQGGTTYKDDEQASFSGVNYGDRTTPLFGTTLALNKLGMAYGVRGSSVYSKVLATAKPHSRVDLYGQFLYSNPKTDARYFDTANGTFGLASALYLSSGQFGSSSANQPHVLGNAGMEVRVGHGFRVVQSFMTNRQHTAGFGALTEQILLTSTATPSQLADALNSLQVINYNQYQIEGIWDVTSKFAVRGGWRHVWGDASVRAGDLDPLGPLAPRDLLRNVGLAGVTARPIKNLSLNLDYEVGRTNTDYFRTSLYNYQHIRARAKYQLRTSLSVQAHFTSWSNQNPSPDLHYDTNSLASTLGIYWNPENRRVSLMAEYTRSTFSSRIDYLMLPFLTPSVSTVRDNAHTGVGALNLMLRKSGTITPTLTLGGTLISSGGTRPTTYYQPMGRFNVPLHNHVQWYAEWRWYGYGEMQYIYEGFRANLIMIGLRLTR